MRLWPAVVLAGVAFAGEQTSLYREGPWWIETISGQAASAPSQSIRVVMRGPVTATGSSVPIVSYTFVRRVRAGSEIEARRLLSELQFRAAQTSGVPVLTLSAPAKPRALAELRVQLPANLRNVAVETHSGDIHVAGVSGSIQARTGAGVIAMDHIGGHVIARTAGGNIRIGDAGGGVKCSSGGGNIDVGRTGSESWFETAGGEIRIGHSGGPIHASTGGGNIHVGRAMSSVAARTAGGQIEVEEARGVVLAGNSGGSVHVGAAEGVRIEATGGGIRLRGSAGALRAISDVGSILAELIPGVRLQDSLFSTGAGDITVYIPSNLALTVRASSESGRPGRIVSEFPEIPVRLVSGREFATLAEGVLNGGGPVLKLTSAAGTIYLRRVRR